MQALEATSFRNKYKVEPTSFVFEKDFLPFLNTPTVERSVMTATAEIVAFL